MDKGAVGQVAVACYLLLVRLQNWLHLHMLLHINKSLHISDCSSQLEMDPSNRKFPNLNEESSYPSETGHSSPSQQFSNNFSASQFSQSLTAQYFHNLYPYGAPANFPTYSHSSPSFQGRLQPQGNWVPGSLPGFQSQGNLVHSPNPVFEATNNRATFVPQHGGFVGGAANTSSHGSESSTPCPARRPEKQSVEIEEVSESSEEEVGRAQRINWTEEENLRLVFAWLNNSVDSVQGNGKKSEYYWKDVANEFNGNRPTNAHKRTVKQLKTHWGNVKRDVAKFCGVYANVRSTFTSGHSDDMIMEKAHEWYKSQSGEKPFTLEYMWRELKDQPKWRTVAKKELQKNKRTKISESGAHTSSSNRDTEEETASKERRPEGQKKAKERLRGKGKGTSSSPLGNPPSENMILFNEAIKIRAEALLKTAEATTKSAEAKWERTRADKWMAYLKLEHKDTSNFSEEKLNRHEAMLKKLAEELAQ